MTKLHEDWIAFLRLLNEHRVRYLVVGAHAVATHDRPRLTADLDIWVEPSFANAKRVAAAIAAFGFGHVSPERLMQCDQRATLNRRAAALVQATSTVRCACR